MTDEERKQVQQETLRTVIEWLGVTTKEYYKRFGKRPTITHLGLKANIEHSALLPWMLEGNEPLPQPPPRRYSRPWHQLVADGEGVALNVWSGEKTAKPNQVIIEQDGWDIIRRTEKGYIATYGDGTTQWSVEPIEGSEGLMGRPQWQLRRIDD